MKSCSDLPSPSLPLNPARLSGFRPGEPSPTSSSSSSAFRSAPADNNPPVTAYSKTSRAPALSPESQQGLPAVYNNRAPAAALASAAADNQSAHPYNTRPPPASLYSSLQVAYLQISISNSMV